MSGKTTNLMGWVVNFKEMFDNPKSSIPTRIRVQAENRINDNIIIEYYKIEGNFYEYMYELIAKVKKSIINFEKTLDKS
jgi:hypothetical protein